MRAIWLPGMGSPLVDVEKPSRKPLPTLRGWTQSSASPVSRPSQAARGPVTPRYSPGRTGPVSSMGDGAMAKRGTDSVARSPGEGLGRRWGWAGRGVRAKMVAAAKMRASAGEGRAVGRGEWGDFIRQ